MSGLADRIRELRRAGLTTDGIAATLGLTPEQVVARNYDPSLADPPGSGGGGGGFAYVSTHAVVDPNTGEVPFDLSGDGGWTEISDASLFACRNDGTIEFAPGAYIAIVRAYTKGVSSWNSLVGELTANAGDLVVGDTKPPTRTPFGFDAVGGASPTSWAWHVEYAIEAAEGNVNRLELAWQTAGMTGAADIGLTVIAHTT